MIAKPGGHDTSKRKRREEGGRKREVTRRNKGNEVLGGKNVAESKIREGDRTHSKAKKEKVKFII